MCKIQYLKKLFAIRFPYNHRNFWPLCLPVKMALKTGHTQSMKIDDQKSNRYRLVNWHRLVSANWWPIDNHTTVFVNHWLPSTGLKFLFLMKWFTALSRQLNSYVDFIQLSWSSVNVLDPVIVLIIKIHQETVPFRNHDWK